MDLIQEGSIGLQDAADKFDPSREASFGTYASQRIHGSIKDALRRTSRIIRVPRKKKLGLQMEILKNQVMVSLDEFQENGKKDSPSLNDSIPSLELTPEEKIIRDSDVQALTRVMQQLNAEQALILNHQYGLNGYRQMNLEDISKSPEWKECHGTIVTEARICQIKNNAIKELRLIFENLKT